MARPRKTPVPDASMTAIAIADDGRMQLSPNAEALRASIEAEWDLNVPSRELLRVLCEQRTLSEAAARELAGLGSGVGGLQVSDAKGAAKPSPMLLICRDLLNSSSATLQKLLGHLG